MNIREIVGLVPVIPVLDIVELQHAVPLARALAAGGLTVLEINLRTAVAVAAIEAVRTTLPDVVVGAGALTRALDFAAAGRAGAQFGATPGFTPELAAAARGARFPLLPGIMTPADLIAVRNADFNVVKLFPAREAGGIGMLRALAAPFPDVVFCPMGGITRDTAAQFLALPNVACVAGTWLAPPSMLAAGDWAGIEALASEAASLRTHA